MEKNQTCKFRIKNMYGHCCGNPASTYESESGTPFCNRHKGSIYNDKQILMYIIFGNNEGLIHSERCRKNIFDYWSKYPHENNFTSLIEMLCYMYDMQSIRYMISKNVATKWNLKQKKIVLAELLVQEWKCIYNLVSNVAIQNVIAKLQERWIRRLQGPYMIHEKCSNDADPFTLTCITKIPKQYIWSFREESGHIYAFHIWYMLRYVEHCHKNDEYVLNPFTRKQIQYEDIRCLMWLEAKTDFTDNAIQ